MLRSTDAAAASGDVVEVAGTAAVEAKTPQTVREQGASEPDPKPSPEDPTVRAARDANHPATGDRNPSNARRALTSAHDRGFRLGRRVIALWVPLALLAVLCYAAVEGLLAT